LISGIDWAIAGAAIAVAAALMPAVFNILRRLSFVMTAILLVICAGCPGVQYLLGRQENRAWPERWQKSGFPARATI
jgi:hypothetical protein